MRIGTVEISSKLALAPMAGVTDAAFRQICSELGAGYTITELISSKALCYHDKKTFSLLTQFPGEHPAAVQIFGSDPVCMAEAAQIAMGQPMLISKISAPVCSMAIWAASAMQTGSLPKICTAAGCSPGNWVSREKVFLSW